MNKSYIILYFSIMSFVFANPTYSDTHLNSIDVENKLGTYVSKDTELITDSNEKIKINKFFNNGLPLVLVMAYYECPMLCTLVLNGLSDALFKSDLNPGEDYEILTVSIDPNENYQLAKQKKDSYTDKYFNDIEDKDFWTFSTTDQKNINKITSELGFNYSYDPKIDQYAHSAVVYVLTDDGMISKQIFGISPTSTDLKLSILSASDNNVSSIFDKIMLYCYQYDPQTGGYSMIASNAMKVSGTISVFLIFIFLSILWIKERIGFERKV